MFFKFIVAVFLIHINPAKVLSYDTCNEFTITIDEFTDIENINTFDFGSFGLLNNLTKQCRNLYIALELDLYREEEKSKLYKNLYGDDLHKLNVTYPLDSDVHEEVITPACPEICANPAKEDRSYYNTILKPIFSQPRRRPKVSQPKLTEFTSSEFAPSTEEFENVESPAPTTDYPYFTTASETTTELTTETSDFTDDANSTEAEKLKKKRNKEGNGRTAIIAAAAVASVAAVGVVSYFAAQMIKTMLQSGSFRFPDPA